MSSTADAAMSSTDGVDDAWGHVASVFNPPKHRFDRGGRDRGPPIEVSPSAAADDAGDESPHPAARPPRSQAIHRPRSDGPPGGEQQHASVDEALSFKFKLSPTASRDFIGGCDTGLSCLGASADDASLARYLLGSSDGSPRASFAFSTALTFDSPEAAVGHQFPAPLPSDLGRSGTFGSECNLDPAGAGFPLPRMRPPSGERHDSRYPPSEIIR